MNYLRHGGGGNTNGAVYGGGPNNLVDKMTNRSHQTIITTDMLSEGPVYGLVDGAASVFLNDDRIIELEGSPSRTRLGPATITLTNGSKNATLSNAGDNPFPKLADTDKIWIAVVGGFPSFEVEAKTWSRGVIAAGINLYPEDSSDTFTSSMVTSGGNARWRNNEFNPARLKPTMNPGDPQLPNNMPVEGVVSRYYNSGKVAFTADAKGIEDGTYIFEVDRFAQIDAINGNNVTLKDNWGGASNTYKYDRLGHMEYAEGVERTIHQRVEGASVDFRPGTCHQRPLRQGENGTGSTAITKGLSLSIEQSTGYGGDQPVHELVGSTDFGLSAAQREDVDLVKIRIEYGSFKNVSGKGNDKKAYIRYRFEIQTLEDGQSSYGPVERLADYTHSGIFDNAHTFEHIFDLEPYKPFTNFKIRVIRLDSDENPGYKSPGVLAKSDWSNVTKGAISGVTSVIKERLNMPYTSAASVAFSSKEFQQLPARSYHMRGMMVQVPSNYVTREENDSNQATYNRSTTTGLPQNTYQDWDGSFRNELVYTNNPAWVFYDILTNNRYGLGDFIGASQIDRYALYRIGRYCDELVPDGKGGTEPRYTMNVYLTKQADAYKVLKDMATNFIGMLYYLDGQIFTSIDAPASPVYTFTKANVIEGAFNYETTGSKTRANQVVVMWNDPDDNYIVKPLIVEDKRNIAKTERLISEQSVAFGCTSEGQATRYGRWKLWTAANQTEIVSFSTGLQGSYLTPGDIINVQDSDRDAIRHGGRISASGTSTANTIYLDSSVTLNAGSTYELGVVFIEPAAFTTKDITIGSTNYEAGDLIKQAYVDPDGNGTYTLQDIDTEEKASNAKASASATESLNLQWKDSVRTETQPISNSTNGQTVTNLTVSPAFSDAPSTEDIWVLTETANTGLVVEGSPKQYKVLGVSQKDASVYGITAAEHYNEKYDAIETDFTTYVPQQIARTVKSTDVVPPVRQLSGVPTDNRGRGGQSIRLTWRPPAGETKTIRKEDGTFEDVVVSEHYEHLDGFMLEHNVPNKISPILLNPSDNIYFLHEVPSGTYTFRVTCLNTIGNKSAVSLVDVDVTGELEESVLRGQLGIPVGGSCSTTTRVLSNGTFEFKDTAYVVRGPFEGSVPIVNSQSSAGYQTLDCSGLPALASFSYRHGQSFSEHHNIVFRSASSGTYLKLIKYNERPSHGVPYWFDAGDGSDTTGLSTINGTTTANSTASTAIYGSGTQFTSDLVVGGLFKQGSVAARVTSIKNNTLIYVDRPIVVDGTTSLQTSNYQINYTSDYIIGRIYKDSNSNFLLTPYLSLDSGLVAQQGIERILYAKVQNLGSAPSYSASSGTFADPSAGNTPTWSLSIPSMNADKDIIYAITRVFTSDGESPQAAQWTAPVVYSRRQDGDDGADAYTINITNTSINLPTTNTGTVTYTNSGTTISVFKGGTELDSVANNATPGTGQFSVSAHSGTNITPDPVGQQDISGNPVVIGEHSSITNTFAKIDYTINCENLATFTKTQHFAKAIEGDPGDNAKTVVVNASSLIFVRPKETTTLSPTQVTITANTQNTTADGVWSTSAGTITSVVNTHTGPSCVVTGANFSDGMVVTYTTASADGSIADSVTLKQITEGADILVASLTNENHTMPASNTGAANHTGSGTDIHVYEGATELTYNGTGTTAGTYKVFVGNTSNITEGSVTTGSATPNYAVIGDHSASANGTDTYIITYTIVGKRQDGTSFTVITEQSLSKARQGNQGNSVTGENGLRTVHGNLYYEKTTSGDPTAPTGTTYTFSTGKVSGTGINDSGTTNVWKNEPNTQSASSGNGFYILTYFGTEDSASSTSFDIQYGSVKQHTDFTGVVTFTGTGKELSDGTTTHTFIEGTEVNSNVTSISGGVIQAGSTIKVGTEGSINGAGMTGQPAAGQQTQAATDVRIYAGEQFSNRIAAPFKVTQQGQFTASYGTIGGFEIGSDTFNSTSANPRITLSKRDSSGNVIDGQSVTLSARSSDDYLLYAGLTPEDSEGVTAGSNPPFAVDASGNVTMNSFELKDSSNAVVFDSDNLLGAPVLSQISSSLGGGSSTATIETSATASDPQLEIEIGATQNVNIQTSIYSGQPLVQNMDPITGLNSAQNLESVANAIMPSIAITLQKRTYSNGAWGSWSDQETKTLTKVHQTGYTAPSLTSTQYWVNSEEYLGRSQATAYKSGVQAGYGCVDSAGNFVVDYVISNLSAGNHQFRIRSGVGDDITLGSRTITPTGSFVLDYGYGYSSSINNGAGSTSNSPIFSTDRLYYVSGGNDKWVAQTTSTPQKIKDSLNFSDMVPVTGADMTGPLSWGSSATAVIEIGEYTFRYGNAYVNTPNRLVIDAQPSAEGFYLNNGANPVTFASSPGSAKFTFDCSTGDQLLTGDLTLGEKIIHNGDTDTHILFETDKMTFKAGNALMMKLEEASSGYDYARWGDTADNNDTITFNLSAGSITAAGNITAYSDERLKKDVKVIPDALSKVSQIRGVTYERVDNDIIGRQTGLIAQELEKVLPEAITIADDEMETKSVAYGNVVGLLVEAIKELKEEIEELKRSK